MNVKHTLAAAVALGALAPGLVAVAASSASASGGGADVIKRGTCSGSTLWKMKAKSRDGRLEVEAEVDSNRRGQDWRWTLSHNGSTSARGTSVTRGPSGSFTVERTTVDAAGTDALEFRAVNHASGEVCVARVSL